MSDAAELRTRARRRLLALERRTRDPRFTRVLGRFVKEKLLVVNHPVREHGELLRVSDVLWAGVAEPRLLELLPALIVKRPALFERIDSLPADLSQAVAALERDREPETFRGIPGSQLHQWLRRVGRVGGAPSRLKSFRFTPADQRVLTHLATKLGVSETEVIRRGLRALV